MADLPRGYTSKEEYFADLDKKKPRRGRAFYSSVTSHGQTRQGRGSTAGSFGAYMANAVGDSSMYDEAYGPPSYVWGNAFIATGGSYDEGFIARRNSRDAAEEKERKAKMQEESKPKKKRKKKSNND